MVWSAMRSEYRLCGKIRSPMADARYVYDFDEPTDGGRELLGGKGIGLAEMTQLGVPVPAGFTITTDACRAYMAQGDFPEGLAEEVDEHLARLEETAGKRFGDPEDPLLVSVRSGAAISMPGMMDTILNVGLNDQATEGLARRTGNERFAQDSYRRLIQMYGETVDGIDAHFFSDALAHQEDDLTGHLPADRDLQAHLPGADRPALPAGREGAARPRRPCRLRLVEYAAGQAIPPPQRIPDDLGTAVNVVQMVFGNKGEQSGTGVAFTRDPSTGEPGLFGEFLADAQGEDVVAGSARPSRSRP